MSLSLHVSLHHSSLGGGQKPGDERAHTCCLRAIAPSPTCWQLLGSQRGVKRGANGQGLANPASPAWPTSQEPPRLSPSSPCYPRDTPRAPSLLRLGPNAPPPFTCRALSLELSLLPPTPPWGAGYPRSLFRCAEGTVKAKVKAKLPFPQMLSPSPSPATIPPPWVLYLVLVGGIKGNLCHLGVLLSHLLDRTVRLLDELEEGRLGSIPCCCPLPGRGWQGEPQVSPRGAAQDRGATGRSWRRSLSARIGISGKRAGLPWTPRGPPQD